MTMEASIIRPNDVTDPDATNPALTPPTNPHLECLNGTAVENCNNIAEASIYDIDTKLSYSCVLFPFSGNRSLY